MLQVLTSAEWYSFECESYRNESYSPWTVSDLSLDVAKET